jgi:hypothetical protein
MAHLTRHIGRRGLFLVAGALVTGPLHAWDRHIRQDFEAMPPGALPTRWVVLEDSAAPAGSHLLAETSRDRTDARFPVAVVDGFEARDVAVSTRFRPVDGRRIQFAGADAPIPRNRWQTLGLVARGDRLEVSLDGRALFAATNQTFPGTLRIGLWTKAESLTHFDALTAEDLA